MVKYLLFAAFIVVAACTPPEGPECATNDDCSTGEVCLGSGGVFFGGSYCAPLGSADASTNNSNNSSADAGTDAGACTLETACDGADNDGDEVVDEGCPCDFSGSSQGVCATATIDCGGRCVEPANYEFDELTCDTLDNDCDGEIDEGQPFTATKVAAGQDHTCALDEEGAAYCWGRNVDGQLGTGDFEDSVLPRKVAVTEPFVAISAGASHSCGIGQNGAIYCWGRNDAAQVSSSGEASEPRPVRIDPPDSAQWISVSAGGLFTCGIAAGVEGTASVFCWGVNNVGQCGQPPSEPITTPTLVPIQASLDAVTAGGEHACAWADGGRAYCWGEDADGRLGRTTADSNNAPLPVAAPPNFSLAFRDVNAGADHTCAFVDATDTTTMDVQTGVVCVGSNLSGQLGSLDDATYVFPMPSAVGPVRAGLEFSCAFESGVGISCWGLNDAGQTGRAASEMPVTPALLDEFSAQEAPVVLDVSTGARHACGVGEEGLKCWGTNEFGQLGTSLAGATGIVSVACPAR